MIVISSWPCYKPSETIIDTKRPSTGFGQPPHAAPVHSLLWPTDDMLCVGRGCLDAWGCHLPSFVTRPLLIPYEAGYDGFTVWLSSVPLMLLSMAHTTDLSM